MQVQGLIAETLSNVGANKTTHAAGNVTNAKDAKIDKAAQDFEAVYISQMLTHMWSGVETNEMFGGGHAEEIYRSLLIDEYGKVIAKQGGLGLTDQVRAEMIALQEKQNGAIANGTE